MSEKVKLKKGTITQEFNSDAAKYLLKKGWEVVNDTTDEQPTPRSTRKTGDK